MPRMTPIAGACARVESRDEWSVISRLVFLIAFLNIPGWQVQAAKPVDPAGAGARPQTIKITMRDGLRFDPPRFEVKPGHEVIISLENLDSTDQMHNFVLAKPGAREALVNASMLLAEKGPALEYVPPSTEILVHSALLGPDKKAALRMTMPTSPGVYPYVCTFPGHGLVMYGAAYVGVKMPPLAKDKNVPASATQSFIAGAGRRPFVQRIFMPDCGPSAIAVALPGDVNACWDAGQCRLRYAWKGGFIDATKNWAGSGKDLPVVLGDVFWKAPQDVFPLRIGGADAAVPKVKFLGYRLIKGFPEFHYTVDGTEVFESLNALPKGGGVTAAFRIEKAPGQVFYEGAGKGAEFTVSIDAAKK